MATDIKQKRLELLKQQIINDKVCPELAKGATQLVFGDGDPDADIIFVGEAPGKSEDEQGLPFVGAAGKFLNEMLEVVGLKRKDVYITNIVKYRPPNNRDPYPDEKAAFLPYLKAQIDIIKPKLIVTLGRHSLNCFLPGLSISQVHGQPKRFRWVLGRLGGQHTYEAQENSEGRTSHADDTASKPGKQLTNQLAARSAVASGSGEKQGEVVLTLLPLFHPAAALYNGGMKQALIDDFAKIPIVLKKIS